MTCCTICHRRLRWLPVASCMALAAMLLLAPAHSQGKPRAPAADAQPSSSEPDSPNQDKTPADGRVEVRFTDNSVIRLSLKEARIAIITKYGKLTVPVEDIQRIDFALRVPDEMAKRIEYAVADLGHFEFRKRQAASAILLACREKAYPAVVKAAKNTDTEIASRAEELIKKFEEAVPAELLKAREFDVIHTENCKIAGAIDAATLKANTQQFGDVDVRLADVFVLSTKSTVPEADTSNIAFGPVNLLQHQNEIGKTFVFKVIGNVAGSVWGTDVYTTDSTLAAVAVHAGLLQPGQTGVIKVMIIPSPNNFVGSTRNGVASSPYQQYPVAYSVRK